jgi:hypothetical protein
MRQISIYTLFLLLTSGCRMTAPGNPENIEKVEQIQTPVTNIDLPGGIYGKWYLNKWTMYHTLSFGAKTVYVDNHIDSVFTVGYSLSGDTLILLDDKLGAYYKEKIIAITKDTLIIKSFGNTGDTLGYSRTIREWKNE